jgi:hypothetical protein
VPKELLEKAKAAILPPSDPPKPPQDLMAATRAKSDPTGTALLLRKWLAEGKVPA